MKKSTINFIINGLMFLCMSAVAGIGFLIKYTLIPGQKRWIVYNANVELYMLGMDRHEWGAIHLLLGYILLGLLVIHILLHLKIICSVYAKLFQGKLIKKFISIAFITICALFLIIPFLINPTINKFEHGAGRINVNHNHQIESRGNTISNQVELKEKEPVHKSHHSNLNLDIKGFMTLDEISKKYKIPIEFLKTRLKIPENVSSEQRLSWYRKEYNITMNDVKETIIEYQNKIE